VALHASSRGCLAPCPPTPPATAPSTPEGGVRAGPTTLPSRLDGSHIFRGCTDAEGGMDDAWGVGVGEEGRDDESKMMAAV